MWWILFEIFTFWLDKHLENKEAVERALNKPSPEGIELKLKGDAS